MSMCPILTKLTQDGVIVYEEEEGFLGTASDGIVVYLGSKDEEQKIEAYLREHPTPDTW